MIWIYITTIENEEQDTRIQTRDGGVQALHIYWLS